METAFVFDSFQSFYCTPQTPQVKVAWLINWRWSSEEIKTVFFLARFDGVQPNKQTPSSPHTALIHRHSNITLSVDRSYEDTYKRFTNLNSTSVLTPNLSPVSSIMCSVNTVLSCRLTLSDSCRVKRTTCCFHRNGRNSWQIDLTSVIAVHCKNKTWAQELVQYKNMGMHIQYVLSCVHADM